MSVQAAIGRSSEDYTRLYTTVVVPLGRGVELMDPNDSARLPIPDGVLQEIIENSTVLYSKSAANVVAIAASSDGQFSMLLNHLIEIGSHKRLGSKTLIFLLRCVTVSHADKLTLINEVIAVRGKEVKETILCAYRNMENPPLKEEVHAACAA